MRGSDGGGPGRLAVGATLALAAMLVLLAGFYGTLAGALVGLTEVARLPAVVLAVALACLPRDQAPLAGIAVWGVIGLLAALGLRAALGAPAWLPRTGEEPGRPDLLLDAGWLCILSVLALRGGPGRAAGPLLAAIIASTRIGGFVEWPVALLREAVAPAMGFTTVALFAMQVQAGVLAAGLVVLAAGWLLARGARAAPGGVAPAMLLAGLGLAAAIARIWQVLHQGS